MGTVGILLLMQNAGRHNSLSTYRIGDKLKIKANQAGGL